eukprot:1186448-Prorocentrum_minimum.AAC.3
MLRYRRERACVPELCRCQCESRPLSYSYMVALSIHMVALSIHMVALSIHMVALSVPREHYQGSTRTYAFRK